MTFRPNGVAISSDFINVDSSSAAEVYIVALSDIITTGSDLAKNRRKASRKVIVERPITVSKCTALEVVQVSRQMYNFIFSWCSLIDIQGSRKIHASDGKWWYILHSKF